MRLPPCEGRKAAGAAARRVRARAAATCALTLALVGSGGGAFAQNNIVGQFQQRGVPQPANQSGEMLLQADNLVYDNDRQVVSAEGGVQIAYNGNTVVAERVVYNRQTRRLVAEGSVRITDAQGNIISASTIDLSDDFRDGFVRTLQLERPIDRTRFSADSATRRPDDITVFERGTYTACEACTTNPERPPLWQVRAARIIHNQQEQRIYYENGTLDFFGVPVAYMPYFWGPDGTVRRQSGFLGPVLRHSSRIGSGYGATYFYAPSPFFDLTLTSTYYTRQGPHVVADWRHNLPNGFYRVRLSGIQQQNPDAIGSTETDVGRRDFRGSVDTWGSFQLTDRFRFGWNAGTASDTAYLVDYGFPAATGRTERVSQVYLDGQGPRSSFESRLYYIRTYSPVSSPVDRQALLPQLTPVIDYQTAVADPYLNGELRFYANLTHVSRTSGMAYRITDPASNNTLRWLVPGFAGDYTRFTIDAQWRRTFTDVIGQRWTPLLRVRGDVYNVDPNNVLYNTIDVSSTTNGAISTGFAQANQILPSFFTQDNFGVRGMPTVGLDYRYPLVATAGPTTHLIEPIAQILVRPNEQRIGSLPNEDSQSLVFDDTNLFSTSKFSGLDRVEGGTRINAGAQYTFQTQTGFLASALFGQSFHVSGLNSYAQGAADLTSIGLDSGLERNRSDYVARLFVQPWEYGNVTARFRFDERTFATQRMDLSGSASIQPLTLSASYTYIAPQPEIGYNYEREQVTIAGGYRINSNWAVSARGTYSLHNSTGSAGWISNGIGLTYADDCITFAIDYSRTYPGFSTIEPAQQRIVARLNLRTLGGIGFGTSLD